MNMYVTYLTTKEEVFEVEIDDKDWEEFAKSEPNFPVFDVNKAYEHFVNDLDYMEIYCDCEEIESVIERVEFFG